MSFIKQFTLSLTILIASSLSIYAKVEPLTPQRTVTMLEQIAFATVENSNANNNFHPEVKLRVPYPEVESLNKFFDKSFPTRKSATTHFYHIKRIAAASEALNINPILFAEIYAVTSTWAKSDIAGYLFYLMVTDVENRYFSATLPLVVRNRLIASRMLLSICKS